MLVLEGLIALHRTIPLSFFSITGQGIDLDYCDVEWTDLVGIKVFPGGSVVKNMPFSVGDVYLIPGSGGSPGEGNGNPLQYSCLGNPMDREAWQATFHRVARDGYDLSTKLSPPPEGMMLSVITERERQILYDFTEMWNLKTKQTNK